MRTTLLTRLLVSSLLLVLGACGSPTGEPGPGSTTTYTGTWQLVEGRGPEGKVPMVAGYRITLTIEGEDVGGTSACNSYGGDGSISKSSFSFLNGNMTDMACKPDVMESESSYIAALQAADTIERDGATLTLTGNGTELRFEVVPPVPTAELVDTRWELETLIYGTGNDGIASSAAPADLLLASDGTVGGTTGCRELYGEWIESGDEIMFTTFGARGRCGEELRAQDEHVVTVLGDGFVPTVEEDRLTIISPGALGLEYRASK